MSDWISAPTFTLEEAAAWKASLTPAQLDGWAYFDSIRARLLDTQFAEDRDEAARKARFSRRPRKKALAKDVTEVVENKPAPPFVGT